MSIMDTNKCQWNCGNYRLSVVKSSDDINGPDVRLENVATGEVGPKELLYVFCSAILTAHKSFSRGRQRVSMYQENGGWHVFEQTLQKFHKTYTFLSNNVEDEFVADLDRKTWSSLVKYCKDFVSKVNVTLLDMQLKGWIDNLRTMPNAELVSDVEELPQKAQNPPAS